MYVHITYFLSFYIEGLEKPIDDPPRMQPTYLGNYHFPLSNFTYTNKAEVNVYVAGGRQEGRLGRGRKQTDAAPEALSY